MRQRLAMARALACDIDLLLMDEPLSALDALLREEMQNMLKRCWIDQGYAQVLVTHSIEEAVFSDSALSSCRLVRAELSTSLQTRGDGRSFMARRPSVF